MKSHSALNTFLDATLWVVLIEVSTVHLPEVQHTVEKHIFIARTHSLNKTENETPILSWLF